MWTRLSLAVLLATGLMTGCVKARHVAVVADATFAQAVFAVDDAEFAACKTHVAPFTVAVCAQADPLIKQALIDVKAVTQSLINTPKSGTLPKDLPSLLANLTAVQAILSPLDSTVVKESVSTKIQQALVLAIGIVRAFTGGA